MTANEQFFIEAASESILSYSVFQWGSYTPARHHQLISEHLEQVESGAIDRLMMRDKGDQVAAILAVCNQSISDSCVETAP